MHDQAQPLRRLVQDSLRNLPRSSARGAKLVVVVGGKGGVGTTSVALNVAVALEQLGRRALLVDADPAGGDIGLLCRLETHESAPDEADDRSTLADRFEHGPAGIRILAGPPALSREGRGPGVAFGPQAMAELSLLALPPEVVLVDAGSGLTPTLATLWEAADAALVVTTPDMTAVVNTYALLKLLRGPRPPLVYCLVNRAADSAAAGLVFGRIHRVCRRFLSLEPRPAGYVPDDPAFAVAQESGSPLVLSRSAAADRLVRAACALNEGLQASGAAKIRRVSEEERFNFKPRTGRYRRTLSVAEQPSNSAD